MLDVRLSDGALRAPVAMAANWQRRSVPVPPAVDGDVSSDRGNTTSHRLAWAIGCWFVLMLFFNDVANLATIKTVINLRPDRLFLPILLAAYAMNRARNNARVRVHPAEWSMLLLLGWSLLSLVIAGTLYHPENRHLSSLINWIGLPLLTFWCVRRSGFSRRDTVLVFHVLIGLGIYLAATAVFEHYEMWALVFPGYIADPRVGIQFGRARGPFCNSAVMGGVLAITYFITLFYINNVRAALWLRGLLGVLAASVYFTYTRSAWLAFIISYVVLGLLNARTRRHCAIVIVIAGIIFLSGVFSKFSFREGTLFGTRQETVEDRANIMQVTVAMIKDKPLFGFGYGTFMSNNRSYFERKGLGSAEEGNHNAFTGLLVDLGVVGFVPYVLTWIFLLRASWRMARRAGPPEPFWSELGAVTVSVLAGYLAGVQFFDPRWFGFLNCLVFFVAGLACAADERYLAKLAASRTK